MASADEAIVGVLAAAGLGLVLRTNLFRGHVRSPGGLMPVRAVFVLQLQGFENTPYMNNRSDWQTHAVQVRVRADAGDDDGGQTLAESCLRACHRAAPAGFLFSLCDAPAPTPLGVSAEGFPEWSFTVRLGLKTTPAP